MQGRGGSVCRGRRGRAWGRRGSECGGEEAVYAGNAGAGGGETVHTWKGAGRGEAVNAGGGEAVYAGGGEVVHKKY